MKLGYCIKKNFFHVKDRTRIFHYMCKLVFTNRKIHNINYCNSLLYFEVGGKCPIAQFSPKQKMVHLFWIIRRWTWDHNAKRKNYSWLVLYSEKNMTKCLIRYGRSYNKKICFYIILVDVPFVLLLALILFILFFRSMGSWVSNRVPLNLNIWLHRVLFLLVRESFFWTWKKFFR